ncbi:MAG: nucleoside transporter C-terminal domain-containing protein [Pseudomonadota bacterium]|nr:nucleoside transporter C-terminal domain-containing protein [Pseudomonadota bacterium]
MSLLQSCFGIVVLLGIAVLFSEQRCAIHYKVIVLALMIQVTLAFILLKIPFFKELFLLLNQAVLMIEQATQAGSQFVFGYLGGGELPFEATDQNATFILAFQALPIILVMSALSYLFYYYRILPAVVHFFGFLLRKTLRTSGTVGLGVAANAFVGMVEAPLLIKPYLNQMSRAELFAVMVAGMSTIAGTMMVLYAHILTTAGIEAALGHILTASVLNVVAALMIALIIIPQPPAESTPTVILPQLSYSAMDAIVQGTADGVKLLINIIAMLIVLLALVHLVNQVLNFLPAVGGEPLTLQRLLGVIMAPLTFLLGIPADELLTAGALLGKKIILNELIAYIDLAQLSPESLSPRSRLIMIYALCGFANIGSLGIMIGGMTVMAPQKRDVIIDLGVKSMLAGVLATCLTATVVGGVLLF